MSGLGRKAYNNATGGTIVEYTQGGKRYRSHTFTSGGTFIVVSKQTGMPFDIVGGGGGGGGGQGVNGEPCGGRGGYGPASQILNVALSVQSYSVYIGGGGSGASQEAWGWGNGGGGGGTGMSPVFSTGGGGGGVGPGDENHRRTPSVGSPDGPTLVNTFNGSSVQYSGAYGNGGCGSANGNGGGSGRLCIRYEIAA